MKESCKTQRLWVFAAALLIISSVEYSSPRRAMAAQVPQSCTPSGTINCADGVGTTCYPVMDNPCYCAWQNYEAACLAQAVAICEASGKEIATWSPNASVTTYAPACVVSGPATYSCGPCDPLQ